MTVVDGKYPNKKDLTPKVEKVNPKTDEVEKVVDPEALPLADPADSDSSAEFRENAQDETGEHKPSAYSQNKSQSQNFHAEDDEEYSYGDREYNDEAHSKWNEHKNVKKDD